MTCVKHMIIRQQMHVNPGKEKGENRKTGGIIWRYQVPVTCQPRTACGLYTLGMGYMHSRPGVSTLKAWGLYTPGLWLDLQRYIRIRISTAYYFTRTCTAATKFISTIYFIKEFEVGN